MPKAEINARMVMFLQALDTGSFKRRPLGVGQKTVNVAHDAGMIMSRRSKPSVMPDLHRLTGKWAASLERFRTEAEP